MSGTEEKKQTISAYIITKDEENNIDRAIESVRWMDEIIVLDSGSSDRTVEKAEKLGAKISVSEFEGFVKQKNKAMDLCSGDWIFNLDADEEVTEELKESVEKLIGRGHQDGSPHFYRISRKTLYMGRWLTHCYSETRARLSKKGCAGWQGEVLHEELIGNGKPGYLHGDLLHRPYSNLSDHIMTIQRYSELWAEREAKAGRKSSIFDIILRPCARFIKLYILRAGFLDGVPGFIASVMGTWYTFLRYARLYEITRIAE